MNWTNISLFHYLILLLVTADKKKLVE